MNWTEYFFSQLDEILAELKTYVEIETPTHNKQAVDQLGGLIKERFEKLGCTVEEIPQKDYGNQLKVSCGQGQDQILILGHFDTVKDLGTLKKEPWRIENGKVYGPGTYDMKAGIVFSYFALKTLIEQGLPLNKKLVFFWNTDEEVGSPSSERWIQEEAKKSQLALVLEPAFGDGDLKTSRKGGGSFTLRAYGKAAHAGNDHDKGINAIEELAHQILEIQSWTNYEIGTTLSVGTVKGGSVTNVIPDFAEATIDVRITKASEAERITRLLKGLTPRLPGIRLEVEGKVGKLPMERTAETVRLFEWALEQAKREGFQFGEKSVGGTSDGNIAASVGTPVLDGLGPVGDGAHASHEHVVIEEIPKRIALLIRLLSSL